MFSPALILSFINLFMLWNTEAKCNIYFFLLFRSSFLLVTAIKIMLLLEMDAGARIKGWHHNICQDDVNKDRNSHSSCRF